MITIKWLTIKKIINSSSSSFPFPFERNRALRKLNSGVSFSFLHGFGALLGSSLNCWSSTTNENECVEHWNYDAARGVLVRVSFIWWDVKNKWAVFSIIVESKIKTLYYKIEVPVPNSQWGKTGSYHSRREEKASIEESHIWQCKVYKDSTENN